MTATNDFDHAEAASMIDWRYHIDPRWPADVRQSVADWVEWKRVWRLICAARERIANGTCSDAVKKMIADDRVASVGA